MSFSREPHNFMRDYAKLSESEKPPLISGILIALSEPGFRAAFPTYTGGRLPGKLREAIRDAVKIADIPQAKKTAMLQPHSFIDAHPALGSRGRSP